MTEIDYNQKISEMEELLKKQQGMIDVLTKIAPQAQMARFMTDSGSLGKKVKVSTYREQTDANPRLISSWRTINNKVVRNQKGEFEVDQRIEITVEPSKADTYKIINLKKEIKEGALSEQTLLKKKKEIENLSTTQKIELDYLTFATSAREMVEVDVVGSGTHKGQTYLKVMWEGDETDVLINFVN